MTVRERCEKAISEIDGLLDEAVSEKMTIRLRERRSTLKEVLVWLDMQGAVRKIAIVVACLCALCGPVSATDGYRTDCESVQSWASHVGQAARRLASATVAAGINSIWDVIPRGSVEMDAGNIQGRVVALGLTVAGHISPQAILELAGALACVVRDDELPVD